LQQRKQLHLKVAESIELVFKDRLHEFYGILALHYSKADNLEKAEEYMVKAGEEALRSSASSEAITYFLQALQIYTEKHGEAADPEKLAAFEKNIALAYFNKGQYQNAVHYFDKVFLRWGRKVHANQFRVMAKLAYDMFIVLLRLHLPWIARKRIPDQRVNEFFDLAHKKDKALGVTNPQRTVLETIGEFRETFKYDLTKLHSAAVSHLFASGLFTATGLYGTAELVLRNAGKLMDGKRITDVATYQMVTTWLNSQGGKWNEIPNYSESLFDACTKSGLFWDVMAYSYWQGAAKAYQGKFNEAWISLEKLMVIEERFQCASGGVRYGLLSELHTVWRRLHEALAAAENLVSNAIERELEPYELQGLGWRGVIRVLMKDIEGAQESLADAERVRRKRTIWIPWYRSSSLLAQFMLDIHLLGEAIGADSRSSVSEYSKAAMKSGKKAVKNSAKFAAHRTWNYRLMGEYYWLTCKQRKALNWFDKSIKEGERLGARPDLSRTYMEVGKRLQEPQSKYGELNGISAREYLDKAEKRFKEMDLEWDLEQLERVRQGT
jgi:tetratricopeptide (TPR) repeat protein